jgi:hypothetical protein
VQGHHLRCSGRLRKHDIYCVCAQGSHIECHGRRVDIRSSMRKRVTHMAHGADRINVTRRDDRWCRRVAILTRLIDQIAKTATSTASSVQLKFECEFEGADGLAFADHEPVMVNPGVEQDVAGAIERVPDRV